LVHQLVNAQRGLVVVSGPTGSGKSTTMAALVQAILNERQVHAVTIEDPIEYELQRGVGIVTQREVGVDETTYMDALVQVLRQTPDVILVGEVRTKLEAEVVFRATEHGRFVIMSTHGRDGISALQKLLSFFPADEQASKAAMLANHLVATIHQSLIPSAQKNGWELAYESFFIGDNTEIMNLVQDPSKYGTLRQKLTDGGWAGCTSMNRVLTKLVADKKISRASAIATSVDSVGLKAMLDAA
jgi:twitching motility protein PilT